MQKGIADRLKEICNPESNLSLLQSQWDFDSRLIPKAIQNISSVFPHYSRHDESHSLQIISNIERILGDRINQLSATDLWLILEASYWHDVGMVVASDDIAKDISSNEFKDFLENISLNKNHELSEFCSAFKTLDTSNCFSAAKTPHEAAEKYRQILAAWYRSKHQDRSAKIVESPWDTAGISSPRTELLPKRLFTLLGSICRLHGASFNDVMKELPLRESGGIGTEICHPRLVACLLRLGDLLDVDDNRFCPVMLKIAGDIPPSSEAHIKKHAAIRHLLVDQDRVEIRAVCQDEDSYEATDQWFKWIEEEFSNQNRQWVNIVPSSSFGGLPTLSLLEANIAPPLDLIDGKNRPRFTTDQEKMLELLQGAGLYENKYQAIRELLQNAVDATLIRLWLDNIISGTPISGSLMPNSQEFQSYISKYSISVRIFKDSSGEDGKSNWVFEIEDGGVGISKADLAKICRVGSSPSGRERLEIVNNMPKWMQPSGTFGIGLQSAFLVSPEVSITTKSAITQEALSARLLSPAGGRRGLVYIRKIQSNHLMKSGTKIRLVISDENIPKRYSISMDDSLSIRVFAAFDPVAHTEIPYEAAKIADAVLKFSEHSPIKISIDFLGDSIDVNQKPFNLDLFDPETCVGISRLEFGSGRFPARVFFRGQYLSKFSPYFNFLSFSADLLGFSAGNTVTVNRNDIRGEARRDIYKAIKEGVTNCILEKINSFTDKDNQYISGFFLASDELDRLPTSIREKWKLLALPGSEATLGDLLDSAEGFEVYARSDGADSSEIPAGVITLTDRDSDRLEFHILCSMWTKDGNAWIQESSLKDNEKVVIWKFSRQEIAPYSDIKLASLLSRGPSLFSVESRYVIPVYPAYKPLASKVENLPWCGNLSLKHSTSGWMVLPFFYDANSGKISTENMNGLIKWTKENAVDAGVSLKEIAELYQSFVSWVDDELMKDNEKWKQLRASS